MLIEYNKSIDEFYNGPDTSMTRGKKKGMSLYEKPRRKRWDLEDAEVGGYGPLIDAFMLLLKIFDKDKVSGMNIMS